MLLHILRKIVQCYRESLLSLDKHSRRKGCKMNQTPRNVFKVLRVNQNLLMTIHAGWHILNNLVCNGTLWLRYHFVWKHQTTKTCLFDPCRNISDYLLDISFLHQSSKRRMNASNIFFSMDSWTVHFLIRMVQVYSE